MPQALLTDALGSVVAVADSSGSVVSEYTYEPFGKTTASGAASGNPFQYTGRENDGTGLYYYRARYYDPQIGRFISEDPIRFQGSGTNFYAYVNNDPIRLADPLGLCAADNGLAKRLACAAQFGRNHSIAAAFGAQNDFLGNLLGGNTVSGLVELGLFISGDTTPTAGQLAAIPLKGVAQGIPVPQGNPGLSGAVGQARGAAVQGIVSAGFNAIAGVGGEPIELGITASGKVATSVAPLSTQTLGNIATGVGAAKFFLDLSTFTAGLIKGCAQ